MENIDSKPQTLAGRVAVVTGATRGIGRAIAIDLASRGCSVLGLYQSEASTAKASDLTRQIEDLKNDARFVGLRADISDEGTPAKVISALDAEFSGRNVDILVNNAGFAQLMPLKSITKEHVLSTLHTNILGPILLMQALLSKFSKSGSARIINVSSESARLGRPNSTAYSASKAAVESLTRSWAAELVKDFPGMTVNSVVVGLTRTDLVNNLPEERVKFWEEKLKETPGGRMAVPEEVASVVGWLAGDDSRWVTGSSVGVTGGNTMIL